MNLVEIWNCNPSECGAFRSSGAGSLPLRSGSIDPKPDGTGLSSGDVEAQPEATIVTATRTGMRRDFIAGLRVTWASAPVNTHGVFRS